MMLLPTQDKEAKESSGDEWDIEFEALPEKHRIEYAKTAGHLLLALEILGYHKGLYPSIEEALNSGDGVYRP